MIKDLRTKLRETSDEDEFQQTLGVIRYLSELKVGSIVRDTEAKELVVVNGAENPLLEDNWLCWCNYRLTTVVRATSELEVVG